MVDSPKLKTKKVAPISTTQKPWTLFQGDTPFGQKVMEILNGGNYAIISTLIMIYSLFADDIRAIFFPLSTDTSFSVATLICMIYYVIQIIVFSLFQKDYFLKYYFWLDIVSTLTMVFDLVWITQYLTGGGKSAANISQISKASRSARLGTRTVRLIRLIRLIKILKQMRALSKDLAKDDKKAQKKISNRLSSIHSKISSLKNVDKAGTLRHIDKVPSKRWSIIKDVQCIGGNKQPLSLNCLPALQIKDQILDKDDGKDSSTKREKKVVVVEEPGSQAKMSNREEKERQQTFKADSTVKKSRFDVNRPKGTIQAQEKNQSEVEIQIPPESKVGLRVRDQIQKNVISMIILILISIPLLDGTTWFNNTTVYDASQNQIIYLADKYPTVYQKSADLFIASATSYTNPLLYFKLLSGSINDYFPDNYTAFPGTIDDILSNTRLEDIDITYSGDSIFAYDVSDFNKKNSIMNICRTVFVSLLLIITTIFFSQDLQFAAIAPLEDMFDTVRKIALNPLNALRQIEERKMCLEQIEKQEGITDNTQPKILQNIIVKIGSLLAIGFGEAGTEIICKVIEDPSIIDVMIPGHKIMALFGFCDIRNFTDATEVLEADVMVFVNEIAAICHRVTYENLGSPNKNIGDAFLLVWKFDQDDVKVTETEKEAILKVIPTPRSRQKADLAVLALVKMISEITKAAALQKYKNNRSLQERIPGYTGVKMGFGLHVGWAIEGPIGSEYKIDASYLGPDVHMASRLQAGTKGYGTGMLITEAVYNLMTENKHNLRWIDRVIPDEHEPPMNLYTVDLITKHLFEEVGVEPQKFLTQKEKKVAKFCQNVNRKRLQADINKNGSTDSLWADDDFKIMQELYTVKFYEQWKLGFEKYLSGKWEMAIEELTAACALAPYGTDGPSEGLIKYMKEFQGVCPVQWAGYRQFD